MENNRSSDGQVYYSGSLTKEEIIELAKLKDAGDSKAREKLIVSHFWLVNKIVSDKLMSSEIFTYKKELYDELYQEGCLGLIEAVDKFDWNKNVFLSTYAYYTIRKYVLKYIREGIPLIKLPEQVYYMCYRHRDILYELISNVESEKTLQECADMMGISKLALESLLKYYYIMSNTYEEGVVTKFDGSSSFIHPEDIIIDKIVPLDFSIFNVQLSEREERVLHLRFENDESKPRSFKKISNEMKISEELVRITYHSAIDKLRDAAKEKNNL